MLGIIKTNIIIGRLKTSSAQFWTNTLCPETLIHRHGPSVALVLAAQSSRCGCRHRTPCRSLAPGSVSDGRTSAARSRAVALTWLMELAAQEASPVPSEASRKQVRSKGTGAMANPADAVHTTRAATQEHRSRNQQATTSFVRIARVKVLKPCKNYSAD